MSELQGHDDWKAERVGKITGSVIGGILGMSPYQDPDSVMRQLVRAHFGAPDEWVDNPATDWGTQHEDEALADFEDQTGFFVESVGFITHPDYPNYGASPDGFLGDEELVEVKCPYGIRKDLEPAFKDVSEVPHYFAQMQWQMFTAQRKLTHFFQWTPNGSRTRLVEYVPSYISEILPTIEAFYQNFLDILADPVRSEPYLMDKEAFRDDIDWLELEERYISALAGEKAAKDRVAQIKAQLISETDGQKTRGERLLVYPTKKEGSVSYAKAIKDLMPDADLTPYQGKPSTSWTVRSL